MTRSYGTEGLGKWALMKINSEVLRQFVKRGFSIDEGIASGLEGKVCLMFML